MQIENGVTYQMKSGMNKIYKVEYWFHDNNEMHDYDRIAIEAKSENEAIEKAKESYNVPIDARGFRIIY